MLKQRRENLEIIDKIILLLDDLNLIDDENLIFYEKILDEISNEYNRNYNCLKKTEQFYQGLGWKLE